MAVTIDLNGRQAFITGGARGLGRRIADRLAEAGATIAISDHPEALVNAEIPGEWIVSAQDLLAAEVEDGLTAAIADLDRLDILVANAGVVPPWRDTSALDLDEWEWVFRINVAGMAIALKSATPRLVQSPTGTAVLTASINAYRAHPSQILYSSTKHAVLGLMRAAALDLGKSGVRVNALAPGPIATPALLSRIDSRHAAGGPAPADALRMLADETALGRIATQDDVADAALYLASDLSLA